MVIATALQTMYGAELATPIYHLPMREPRERRLAHQFMFIHNAVIAEQQQTGGTGDPEQAESAN